MTGFEMFWPIVGQALLVMLLYALLCYRRARAVRQGLMSKNAMVLGKDEHEDSLKVRNAIANQFEIPVLFYVCCVLLYITEADNLPSVVAAWLFVATRYAHAAEHVMRNRVKLRAPLFMVGFALLAGMWAWLVLWMATS